jgi:predicted DCC family thiol-disulfide oxidoreductase YuxK
MIPKNVLQNSGVILFDGVCNYCNWWVSRVLRYDKKKYFYFAPLQSEIGKRIFHSLKSERDILHSLVFIDKGKIFYRSDAAVMIARKLRFPHNLLYAGIVIPRPVRNWVYDWIARNRYKWFGKRESCVVPTADVKDRFL